MELKPTMESGKTLIIAEAGVNHNGSLDTALAMVREAARAGADYVKFQTFAADRLVTATAPKAAYQNANDPSSRSQLDMLRALELTESDFHRIAEECQREGIGFMSTPFDIPAAEELRRIGQDIWKIPSGEITNLPLLRHLARLPQPIIMSTGMATGPEIAAAMAALTTEGKDPADITLLHCTSAYPTPYADVNLRAMLSLREYGAGAIGYSDHTSGIEVAIAAVAMGAAVVEKHFTHDIHAKGPDHLASLTPETLAELVRSVRHTEEALGSATKKPTPAEADTAMVARKSIVAACAIRAGESFTEANLTTKRPANGLSPMLWWDRILGTPADRDYQPDELIEPPQ